MVASTSKYGYYSKQFEPTSMTGMEKFKLFFKKAMYTRDIVYKSDIMETVNVVKYKTLNGKTFILDSYGWTHIKLPNITISLEPEE